MSSAPPRISVCRPLHRAWVTGDTVAGARGVRLVEHGHLARGRRARSGRTSEPRAAPRVVPEPSAGALPRWRLQLPNWGALLSTRVTCLCCYYSPTSRVMFISFQDYCQQRHSRQKLNYISLGSSREVIYCCLLFPPSPQLSMIACAPACRSGDAVTLVGNFAGGAEPVAESRCWQRPARWPWGSRWPQSSLSLALSLHTPQGWGLPVCDAF